MKIALEEFGLGLPIDRAGPAGVVFRPLTWPPARDWPVSVDETGAVVSRWGDPIWDLSSLAGTPLTLSFDNSKSVKDDPVAAGNSDLLRMAITWQLWGPRALRKTTTILAAFYNIKPIFTHCTKNRILARDLMRFPRVLEGLPDVIMASKYDQIITTLHRFYDARDTLGFTLIEPDGLRRLREAKPDHDTVQTAYIPPRIWLYQVSRLRECLDDFLEHKEALTDLFQFCLSAYVHNFGSLANAINRPKHSVHRNPFNGTSERVTGCVYRGSFEDAAKAHGVYELLAKWIRPHAKQGFIVTILSTYFSLVTHAGLAYIANFSLQRKEEVAALRTSCLIFENDQKLGRVPILCGETTKTEEDSDARWVVSPSVEIAVEALTLIARLRMICDRENRNLSPAVADINDPYLFSLQTEPWSRAGSSRRRMVRYDNNSLLRIIQAYPKLFDLERFRCTEEDWKIAKRLTPNLRLSVGDIWPLAWHQYRRTGAVNMFASGLISDSTIQQLLKHTARLMPLYYGRGYSRLHLNENVEAAVVAAMYESMSMQLATTLEDRYVCPHSLERKDASVINLLDGKDLKTLSKWAKSGRVSFRENRLGGCMKSGACSYGGVESVAQCAGGDGAKPCAQVLFDREKEPMIQRDLIRIEEEMSRLPIGSPRYRALLLDKTGMENYLDVIHAK